MRRAQILAFPLSERLADLADDRQQEVGIIYIVDINVFALGVEVDNEEFVDILGG